MFSFTINGRHYNQTTKEIVGQDVIQAMIELFQSKIASGRITQTQMTQHLERIFTEQRAQIYQKSMVKEARFTRFESKKILRLEHVFFVLRD